MAAIKLQERQRIAAYPHANVAWYVHPPALAGADYSAIDKLLESSLVRCTVGGQELKLRCVGLHDRFEFKRSVARPYVPKVAKSQCLLAPFLILLFINYYGSLVITISHREKLRSGLFE